MQKYATLQKDIFKYSLANFRDNQRGGGLTYCSLIENKEEKDVEFIFS